MARQSTRRDFLKSTAAAIAAPYIITSNALGNGTVPAASDRITVGHIGVGNRGDSLLSSFLQVPNSESVAVCDPFQHRRNSRAAQIHKTYGHSEQSCKTYRDFRELLADASIDAVVIATPDHWHVPIAIAAAKAGKDMYVEKPLGISVNENKSLRSLVRAHSRIFQYGTQQRSGQNFRFACELARNGYLGDLHTIHAWCPGMYNFDAFHEPGGAVTPAPIPPGFDYDLWLGPAPYSPYTIDRCTEWGSYYCYDNSLGFIAGWGAHPLDIAQWGNKTDNQVPVTYTGQGTIYKSGLYDVVDSWDFQCTYENSVVLQFMSDHIAQPRVAEYRDVFSGHGTTFFGSDGWVSVDREGIYANPVDLLDSRLFAADEHLFESANHQQNFIDCVINRSDPISPIESAVQSDIICHVCDIAIRLDLDTIHWDNVTETIPDQPLAQRRLHRSMRSPWVM